MDLEVICDMPLANQNEVSMLKVALVDEQSNRLLVNETIEAMIEPMGDGNYIEIFYSIGDENELFSWDVFKLMNFMSQW